MEEGSKRRLVGAVVVVLLLVVFLPMLLEEDVRSPVPESALEIPPRPDIAPDFDAAVADPPEEPALLAPELPPPALYEAPPEGLDSAVLAPEPEVVAMPAPPVEPPPARAPAPAGLSSWVIQVAALTELQRARALEKDLRAKGFPAFIEQADVGGKTFHRVRVGPEAERSRIDTLAASLKDKTGLEGQIKRYP